tara:strand:- start:13071 stop:14054 length:984 start_codon:yes stop_codon:yes gene_type:complete
MTEKLFLKTALTEDLLLVDGLARAGKMVTSKLVSHMEGIEFIQVREPVDQVPMLYGLGQFDAASAGAFLRMQLDVAIHDRAIGRNLNLRVSDGTTLLNAPDLAEFTRRAEEPSDAAALAQFLESGLVPFFFTHQAMPFMSLFFDIAANLKVLEVVRHPVTLAASWYRRGWGERWSTDPRVFTVMADRGGHAIPWFALDWADEFLEGAPMDRVLRSVLELIRACDDGVAGLTGPQRDSILFVPYERLICETDAMIGEISGFLGVRPGNTIDQVCNRENLPKTMQSKTLSESLALIERHGSQDLVEQLLGVAKSYEEKWGFTSALAGSL